MTRILPSLPRALLLSAWICALGPAARGLAEDGASVVYLGQRAGTGSAGQALLALARFAPDVDAGGPRHVLERFPGDRIAPLGAGSVERCEGSPVSAQAYRATLDQVYQATMDLEDTRPMLTEILASQACLSEPVEPSELAYVAFLAGVLGVSDGDAGAANAAFRDVFAIHIDYPWDDAYPPDAHDGFSRALVDVARAEPQPLAVELGDDLEIWLDGRPLEAMQVEVVPGRHLLQVRTDPHAELTGFAFLADAPVRIVDVGSLGLRGTLAPERIDGALTDLAGLLRTEGRDAGPTFVVLPGEEPRAWLWDAETSELEELSAALGSSGSPGPVRTDGPHPAVPILVGVGAGLSAAGGLIAGIGWADLKTFNAGVESGDIGPFPGPDHPSPGDFAAYQTWQRKVRTIDAGLGMLIGGGVTLGVAIPVGLLTRDKGRQVVLGTQLRPGLGPDGPTLDGVGFTLWVR